VGAIRPSCRPFQRTQKRGQGNPALYAFSVLELGVLRFFQLLGFALEHSDLFGHDGGPPKRHIKLF